MKTFIITVVIILVVAAAGTTVYLNGPKKTPSPGPAAESTPKQTEPTPVETVVVPKPEPPRLVSRQADEPAPVPVTDDMKPDRVPAALSQAVDILISPQASFRDRRALWQKLKEAGELDQVIAELRRRAANDPGDPEIPTALGVGLMNKFPVRDFNEAAMLGLQIDQNFDAALKLDPANWEAQYEKAHAMSYWPDVAGNKGPEIIQRLSGLIDQQEKMTSQPQFAKTYVLLGDQYQKAGQPAYAQSTWQLGLARFPNDSALQKRINTPPSQ